MAKEDKSKQGKSADKPERKPAPQQQQKQPKKEAQAPKKEAAPKAEGPQIPAPPARLATFYKEKVVPDLMQKFGYKTVMQVPRIRKITVNMGVGETTSDKKVLDHAVADMTKIAGQKPVVTLARRSIANFKVRAGFPVVSNRAFDGRGNYSLGFKEQIIFPEIEYDKIDVLRGMNIAITTTAKNDDEARALLAAFRFPFKH